MRDLFPKDVLSREICFWRRECLWGWLLRKTDKNSYKELLIIVPSSYFQHIGLN